MFRTCLVIATLVLPPAVSAAEVAASDTCGTCHRDIYRMWRESAHAEATEDPFFWDVYRDVGKTRGSEAAERCLACHAPIAVVTGDTSLSKSVSREGVGCEYCHGLVDVEIGESGIRPRLEIGNVKRGTIAEADSPAHGVAFSELHATSRVCAPCHEYVSPRGAAVLTTYSEWAASEAAERGQTCQTCHMSVTEGRVVEPRVKRDSTAKVNLHSMPGGHSLQQLHKALAIKIRPERGAEGSLDVEVTVENRGAGHAVPTGMPGRRIVMLVTVDTSGGESYREERVYSKTFLRADGGTVDHVADYFTEAAALGADSRIAADETRTERFRFPLPGNDSASVSVKLHYEHAPRGPEKERVWITFYSERRFVRPLERG